MSEFRTFMSYIKRLTTSLLPRYILRRANEAAAGHHIDPDLTWLLTPVGSTFLINQQWNLQVKCSLILSDHASVICYDDDMWLFHKSWIQMKRSREFYYFYVLIDALAASVCFFFMNETTQNYYIQVS